MAEVSKATLVLTGDTGKLRRALGRAKGKMRGVGASISRRAKRMGKAVAAAAATAGAAMAAFAVKSLQASAKFERSMTKVSTLVGLSSERVRGMRDDVLSLAAETGQAPTQLANALFRLTSGGERGADVLRSLRKAAQGARIGMGNVGNLTRVATSTVQAFASQGADLNSVLNTLFFTIREGNVRVDRLQNALGQVQGTAAEVGLSFQDLGAFLATVSRTMGDTQKGARGLRQFLARLQDPTSDIEQAFREAGTSVEEFNQRITRGEFVPALIDMVEGARANDVAIGRLTGSVRALTPILSAAGAQSDEFLRILKDMPQAQAEFDSAVDETSNTLADLIARVRSTWQVFKINFGERLTPLATDMLNTFRQNMPAIASVVAESMARVLDAIAGTVEAIQNLKREIGGTSVGRMLGFSGAGPQGRQNRIRNTLVRVEELMTAIREGERETVGLAGASLGLPSDAGLERLERFRDELDFRLQEAATEAGDNAGDKLVEKVRGWADRLRDQDFTGILSSGLGAQAEEAGRRLSEFMLRGITGAPNPFGVLGQTFGGGGGGGTGGGQGFGGFNQSARDTIGRAAGDANEKARRFSRNVDRAGDNMGDAGGEAQRGTTVFQGLSSALSQVAGVADNTVAQILSVASALGSLISRISQGAGAGGIIAGLAGFGTSFAGFFAHGGSIGSGQFGVVGESGPELVQGPAEVSPMGALAGATLIDASGLSAPSRWSVARDIDQQRLRSAEDDIARQTGRKPPRGR